MPCNTSAFQYLSKCGTSGRNFNYIQNGGGIKDPFEKSQNHTYIPYVIFALGDTIYATADPSISTIKNNGVNYDMDQKTYIQSFEMTIGTSFEGNISFITCDYETVKKLISIVPPENCEFDKFFMGGSGDINGRLATAYIDIGWIIRGCDDSVNKYGMKQATQSANNFYKIWLGTEQNSGPYIYGLPQSVNVSSDGGSYKVTMKFIDGFQKVEQNRLDTIIFNEAHKGRLAEAIKKLAKYNCKTRKEDGKQEVAKIRYLAGSNKRFAEWDFPTNDGKEWGPFTFLNPNRLSLFEYYREILNTFTTNRKKGFSFAYDNGSKGKPTILLLEDRQPNFCVGEEGSLNFNNIPTYIVGGGDCSPVIKFNTQYQATPLQRTTSNDPTQVSGNLAIGGGNPSGMGQKPVQIFKCIREKNQKTGNPDSAKIKESETSNGVNTSLSLNYTQSIHTPPNQVAEKLSTAINANITAGFDTDNLPIIGLIKAELEIHGDPFWANTLNWIKTQYVKIIFINPYCVNIKTGSCDNLAESTCNSQLSGIYQVKSCRHTINAGSYSTTLELFNIDIEKISTK